MTVKDLIEELQKVKDKNKIIEISIDDTRDMRFLSGVSITVEDNIGKVNLDVEYDDER